MYKGTQEPSAIYPGHTIKKKNLLCHLVDSWRTFDPDNAYFFMAIKRFRSSNIRASKIQNNMAARGSSKVFWDGTPATEPAVQSSERFLKLMLKS